MLKKSVFFYVLCFLLCVSSIAIISSFSNEDLPSAIATGSTTAGVGSTVDPNADPDDILTGEIVAEAAYNGKKTANVEFISMDYDADSTRYGYSIQLEPNTQYTIEGLVYYTELNNYYIAYGVDFDVSFFIDDTRTDITPTVNDYRSTQGVIEVRKMIVTGETGFFNCFCLTAGNDLTIHDASKLFFDFTVTKK